VVELLEHEHQQVPVGGGIDDGLQSFRVHGENCTGNPGRGLRA
jgi:hypothetical protein